VDIRGSERGCRLGPPCR